MTPAAGTAVVGAVCALVAGAVAGIEGLLAGGLATVLVVAFFASGSIPLLVAGTTGLGAGPGAVLLLLTYTLRLMLVLAALTVAARADLVHGPSAGLTVIVCALAWCALQVAAVLRPSAEQRPQRIDPQ
jgi:hypothetical protein